MSPLATTEEIGLLFVNSDLLGAESAALVLSNEHRMRLDTLEGEEQGKHKNLRIHHRRVGSWTFHRRTSNTPRQAKFREPS